MPRIPALDTLRAVAIVWVMLFHSYLVGGLGDGFGLLERSGWMGVDLFFVLSGFLIGSQVFRQVAATGRIDLRRFFMRRATRILPAFLVVLALYALWPAWREVPDMQPLWQFPTFTFNLAFDDATRTAFSHVWSLCVEEHFYLVFPFLVLLLAPCMTMRHYVMASAAMVVGGMLLRGWLWQRHIAPALVSGEGVGVAYLRYLYYPTYARLDGLLAGLAVGACSVFRPRWMGAVARHAAVLAVLGALGVVTAVVLFDGHRADVVPCVLGYPWVAAVMGLWVLLGAARGSAPAWCPPAARWLAQASYSLYLSHKGMFALATLTVGHHLDHWPLARFAAYAAATLAGGALLHYGVERPFLRYRRRAAVPAAVQSAV